MYLVRKKVNLQPRCDHSSWRSGVLSLLRELFIDRLDPCIRSYLPHNSCTSRISLFPQLCLPLRPSLSSTIPSSFRFIASGGDSRICQLNARRLPAIKSTTSSLSPSPAQWRFPIYLPAPPNQPRPPPRPPDLQSSCTEGLSLLPEDFLFQSLPRAPVLYFLLQLLSRALAFLFACEHPLQVRQALSFGFSPAFGISLFFFTLGYLSIFRFCVLRL
jgi:hypothetical protein